MKTGDEPFLPEPEDDGSVTEQGRWRFPPSLSLARSLSPCLTLSPSLLSLAFSVHVRAREGERCGLPVSTRRIISLELDTREPKRAPEPYRYIQFLTIETSKTNLCRPVISIHVVRLPTAYRCLNKVTIEAGGSGTSESTSSRSSTIVPTQTINRDF